jgi:Na+-transporting methylmalonyl-CoA/oxaloacetate decarboxylase gamma subunit
MARIDIGSIIVGMTIVLVFLLVILGMLTKCSGEVATFLSEPAATTTLESQSLS